jgi:hypothetical protein
VDFVKRLRLAFCMWGIEKSFTSGVQNLIITSFEVFFHYVQKKFPPNVAFFELSSY